MSYVVGLTGGIGSGKTVISDYLASLGVPIIDTDIIAREIVELGSPVLTELAKRFGESILQKDGSLNREELRTIAFSSPENKAALDAITHPAIRERSIECIRAVTQLYCVVVVPLLVGSEFIKLCDRILVVTTEKETKIGRVKKRSGLTRQQVLKIMASQSSDEERLGIANDVIRNDSSIENAHKEAHKLHELYLSLATKHSESTNQV